ncbi:MAG: segregation/condensation protein A [Candidatus Omnitrophica bacterium]|nr:segregation/condensation protein A [Candidatus Omnitrophota bacterium]
MISGEPREQEEQKEPAVNPSGHDGTAGEAVEPVKATEDKVPDPLPETPVENTAVPDAVAGDTAPVAQRDPMHVTLKVYDGPLELLLDLIRENKMDIYDIQISEITRQYLDYLAQMRELDLEVAGEFIVIAATLIYIKSRMLLPSNEDDEDEEGGDPRAELVQKLLEYQAFKEAAKELGLLEGERAQIFTRQIADYYLADLDPSDVGIDTFSANLYDLLQAFQTVLTKAGRKNMHEVFEEIVSIEEKMTEIQALLMESKRILFSQLFQANRTRNELIATFLAMLELVRTKFARVRQDKQFAEIYIEKVEQPQA